MTVYKNSIFILLVLLSTACSLDNSEIATLKITPEQAVLIGTQWMNNNLRIEDLTEVDEKRVSSDLEAHLDQYLTELTEEERKSVYAQIGMNFYQETVEILSFEQIIKGSESKYEKSGLPCFEAYQTSMAASGVYFVGCMAVVGGSGIGAAGCGITAAAIAYNATLTFHNCMDITYPGGNPEN